MSSEATETMPAGGWRRATRWFAAEFLEQLTGDLTRRRMPAATDTLPCHLERRRLPLWANDPPDGTPEAATLLLITAYWVWAAIRFFRLPWWSGLPRGLGAMSVATLGYMIVIIAAVAAIARYLPAPS